MITMVNVHYSQAAYTPQIGYIWTDASGTTFGQLNFTRLGDITFRGAGGPGLLGPGCRAGPSGWTARPTGRGMSEARQHGKIIRQARGPVAVEPAGLLLCHREAMAKIIRRVRGGGLAGGRARAPLRASLSCAIRSEPPAGC
jgi:hypothetical protein